MSRPPDVASGGARHRHDPSRGVRIARARPFPNPPRSSRGAMASSRRSISARTWLPELLFVEIARLVPAQILVHAPDGDLHEGFLVIPELVDGLSERPLELIRLGALEREPGAVVEPVEVSDGVAQSSDVVHHRDGAVVHRVQLVQAARLETRRHEEEIRSGGDAVRHLVAEPDPRANGVVVAVLHLHKTILQVSAARAQEDNLHILRHEKLLRVED